MPETASPFIHATAHATTHATARTGFLPGFQPMAAALCAGLASLALAVLFPAAGAAQSNRLFNDALFFGVKVGLMNYSTAIGGSSTKPLIGGEMLVTRTHGGLLLSADQAYFTSVSSVPDNIGAPFAVNMKNMRRFAATAMIFPVSWKQLRPYGGLGFSLNVIQSVGFRDTPTGPDQQGAVQANLTDTKDRTAFHMLGGLQAQYQRFSLFGQVTYMPAQSRFLFNGRSTYFLEGGLRFNVAKAKSGN